MHIEELEGKAKTELLTLAKEKGIAKAENLNKEDIVLQLLRQMWNRKVMCSATVSLTS